MLAFHTSRVIRNAIMMPAMSPLMTEGAITRWFKREGEAFRAGEAILEIVRAGCRTSSSSLLIRCFSGVRHLSHQRRS
ncbi:hypothetical protein BDN71DRAFT_1439445 [Pleurotus eryngii]|uniref:Lipoyl-binding domain-containing protein n=1 Tax=Pleurotus eryngii TaxID=5323 RepID=A0A9P6AAY6_PLEER|nr:hypothetical protein BDN71DRAFT_1439445 [Pleurotus eryngii]